MPPDLASQVFIALIPLFLLAVGQGLVMTGGSIDLAAPGVVMAATAAGSWVFAATSGSVGAATGATLATGLALGILHGVAVSLLPLAAWMVSLASLGICAAAASAFSAFPEMAHEARALPAWTGLALLVGLTLHLAREKLVFGPWLRAISGDRESARVAGVPVVGTTIAAYGLSGACAGLAAVFVASHPTTINAPSPWWLVDILGVVAVSGLGGSSRRGSVPGVLIGALLWVGLGTFLTQAGFPSAPILVIKCAVALSLLSSTARVSRTRHPG